MDFETIEPSIWKPEKEGDSVEGVLKRKDENVGRHQSRTYHLETEIKQIMVWGSTILDERMIHVDIDDYCKITFKGLKPNKLRQNTKIYKVERAKKPTVDLEGDKID